MCKSSAVAKQIWIKLDSEMLLILFYMGVEPSPTHYAKNIIQGVLEQGDCKREEITGGYKNYGN